MHFLIAVEGAVLALNQENMYSSFSFISSAIYDKFIAKVIERTNAIKMGNPL
jgi:aldehyde dehydrogenase